jgi:hypothetical protein
LSLFVTDSVIARAAEAGSLPHPGRFRYPPANRRKLIVEINRWRGSQDLFGFAAARRNISCASGGGDERPSIDQRGQILAASGSKFETVPVIASRRAARTRAQAPAKQSGAISKNWIASSRELLAMTSKRALAYHLEK